MRVLTKLKKPKATRILGGALGLLLVLTLVLMSSPVSAVPPMGHIFYGNVTSEGEPVDEGTVITAKVAGLEYTTTVDSQSRYGWESTFEVPGDDPDTPEIEGASPDDPIEFYIGDIKAYLYDVEAGNWLESYPFEIGGYTELNLETAIDIIAPTVVGTTPEDGATNEAIDVVVNATFSEDVTAVGLSGITIAGATGVSATLDEATDTITIAHDDFAYETTYEVTIPAGAVEDLAGLPLAEAKVWSFTTEAAIDIIAPTVLSTTPEADATNQAIDVVVSATFDEDVTAVDLSGITIAGATGVSATLDEATDTITIAHEDFAYEIAYTVTIPAGAVEDLATVPNANEEYTWSFTTEAAVDIIPPAVLSTTPEADATNQAIDVVVSATFDEDVTAVDLSGITLDGVSGVSATLDEATDTITIAHDDFALLTSYTVTIPAGAVEDLATVPNANEEYTWSFTTVVVTVTHSLTMAVVGEGTVTPESGTYAEGDMTITATPASGWSFAGWSTDDMGEIADASLPETTLTLDKDKTVTATFTELVVFTTSLSAGWNLLSTPIKLDADSDALEQILGVSLANIDTSYRWDAVNEQWAVPTGYELSPLEAVYLKVKADASATAEFIPSQELSELPSRELQPGLNLIGPAPALEAGVFPAMPLDQALISIADAEGGLRGYTMVVSPEHNQTAWAYALGGEIKDLLPYKGYWVVMENADTLFGFSTTPIE